MMGFMHRDETLQHNKSLEELGLQHGAVLRVVPRVPPRSHEKRESDFTPPSQQGRYAVDADDMPDNIPETLQEHTSQFQNHIAQREALENTTVLYQNHIADEAEGDDQYDSDFDDDGDDDAEDEKADSPAPPTPPASVNLDLGGKDSWGVAPNDSPEQRSPPPIDTNTRGATSEVSPNTYAAAVMDQKNSFDDFDDSPEKTSDKASPKQDTVVEGAIDFYGNPVAPAVATNNFASSPPNPPPTSDPYGSDPYGTSTNDPYGTSDPYSTTSNLYSDPYGAADPYGSAPDLYGSAPKVALDTTGDGQADTFDVDDFDDFDDSD